MLSLIRFFKGRGMDGRSMPMPRIAAFMLSAVLFCGTAARADKDPEMPFWNTELPIGERVADLVSRLTLEEKIAQMYAEAPAIPRLGVPDYVYGNEALHGIVGPGKFTVFPQAIAIASTWDPELVEKITTAISDEAWGAINRDGTYPGPRLRTFWSPTINMARDPRWGRTPETYGEDPYLTSRTAVAFVKGLQGHDPKYIKTGATPKHFVANNEDHNRSRCNAVISERTLREYYFPAYRACVTEGNAQSIMGAYNAVNGVPCNANEWLLTDVLRGDWGFTGYVVTDCGAPENLYTQHHYAKDGVEAAAVSVKAGADVECGGRRVFPTNLKEAYDRGMVAEADLDRAVTNLFRVRMRLGMFDPPEMVPFTEIPPEVIGSKEHVALARRVSAESMVLLKNEAGGGGPLLPLDDGKLKSIVVLGPNADVVVYGDYSGSSPNEPVTPLAGIRARAGGKVEVKYVEWIPVPDDDGYETVPAGNLRTAGGGDAGVKAEYFDNPKFEGDPVVVRTEESPALAASNAPEELKGATGVAVRWSGRIVPSAAGLHHFTVKTAGGFRFYVGGGLMLEKKYEKKSSKPAFKKGVVLDAYALEKQEKESPMASAMLEPGREYEFSLEYYSPKGVGSARLEWAPPSGERAKARAEEMAAADGSDVVIAVMGYRVEDEHESIDRVSLDLPRGQTEYLKALLARNPNVVVVLINGSPVTINWIAENVPSILEAWYPGEQGGNALADVLFGDVNPAGRLPLTFYSSMEDLPPFDDYEISHGRTYMYLENKPLYPFGFGLSYTDFEYSNLKVDKTTVSESDTITVDMDVKNTGGRGGDEVAQVYVRYVNPAEKRPLKQLKGFRRVHVEKDETAAVSIPIVVKDLAFWDDGLKKFVVEPGEVEILAGPSSGDIRLKETIEIVK